MGLVYEGMDSVLQRRVAIKTIIVENLDSKAADEYESRFRTEALAAARLQHPNIVTVYDFGRHEGVAYLVMQYIEGDDLKDHLDRREKFPPQISVAMILDLLSALDAAHENNIVHRDIKPANMLIEKGRGKLTDFGVARIQDPDAAHKTQGGAGGIGTPRYMSPEQAQGQRVDSRSDLFSTGIVLYELLTGVRPFDGDNPFAIIHQIISTVPPPPTYHNNKLPKSIDAVVARALAKNRDERFSSARDFAMALKAAGQRVGTGTVATSRGPAPGPVGSATMPGGSTVSDTASQGGSNLNLELELEYWKEVKDSEDADDFLAFLEQFPNGKFAGLAQRRLKKLGHEVDEPPAPAADTGGGRRTQPPNPTNPAVDDDQATRLPGHLGSHTSGTSGTGGTAGMSGSLKLTDKAVVASQDQTVISPATLRVISTAARSMTGTQPAAADAVAARAGADEAAQAKAAREAEAERAAEEARAIEARAAAAAKEVERLEAERLAAEAQARAKADAEAKARADAQRQADEEAKRQAEATRLKAETEARAKADAEAKA